MLLTLLVDSMQEDWNRPAKEIPKMFQDNQYIPECTDSHNQRKQLFKPSICLSSALNHHQNQTLGFMCACYSAYSMVVFCRLFFSFSGRQQATNSLKMVKEVQWQFHQKTLIIHMFSKMTRALTSKIVIWRETWLRAGPVGILTWTLPLVLLSY